MASYNWPLKSFSVGSFVAGGTAGSVLYVGAGGTLGQSPTTFFHDYTNGRFGLGNAAAVASGRAASAGDYLILGNATAGAANRSAIRFSGAGYDSTPSAANAESNGDKFVFFNDATGKVAVGLGSNYNMWFQTGATATTPFTWYQAATAIGYLNSGGFLLPNNLAFQQYDSSVTIRSILKMDSSDNVLLSGRAGVSDFYLGLNNSIVIKSTGAIGFSTAAPISTSVTLASTLTNGIIVYNTADQTTNYERVREAWATNVYTVTLEKGGTGTARDYSIVANSTTVTVGNSGSGALNISRGTSGIGYLLYSSLNGANSASGVQTNIAADLTVTQSGTAGYRAISALVTETSTGSGEKTLFLGAIAGSTKFRVDNTGLIETASATMIKSLVALTNGAAASVGTLTNAPAAGNPTKWIPINDNGTTRYIPAW